MRYNQLKPHTEYATARGLYVKTGDIPAEPTIERQRADGTPVDPWSTARKSGSRRATAPRTAVPVTAYQHVDANGRPVGEGFQVDLATAEIAGLWEDYLALHGDYVRWMAQCNEAYVEAKAVTARWDAQKVSGYTPILERDWNDHARLSPAIVLNAKTDSGRFTQGAAPESQPTPTVTGALTVRGPENIDKVLKALGLKPVFSPPAKPARKRTAKKVAAKKVA